MYTVSDLNSIMENLLDFMETLVGIEQEKLEATTKKNVDLLEEIMRKQQAQMMRFKGYDRKREAIQKELGFENLSFREIAKQSKNPDELDHPVFEKLEKATNQYRELNELTKKSIEINLHALNKAMQASQVANANLKDGTIFKNSKL